MSEQKATASKAKNTKVAPEKAATAADTKAAADEVQVSCTVLQNGCKIRHCIMAAGKSITLPVTEAKALAEAGLLKIG